MTFSSPRRHSVFIDLREVRQLLTREGAKGEQVDPGTRRDDRLRVTRLAHEANPRDEPEQQNGEDRQRRNSDAQAGRELGHRELLLLPGVLEGGTSLARAVERNPDAVTDER